MKNQPETVIVFCPNWVGDVVMSTPVLACIRENYPNAKLIGIIRKYARGVVDNSPWFDRIIDCNDKTVKGLYELVQTLRNIKPDIALLLTNSFRSSLIAKLGGAKRIYGYRRNARSFLLSDGPKPLRGKKGIQPVSMIHYYMEICRFLNLKIPETTKPTLFVSNQISEKGEKLLEGYNITSDDMVIGMNPGAKFGSSKCWPLEYFAQLAELFSEQWDCKIMLFAGPGEEDMARSISEQSKAKIINTGPDKIDLSLLKYMVKRCNLLVTNDTGTRHYAVAFDIPVVVIMGSTDPVYTASNLEKTIVLRKDIECSPCHKKSCPEDHHQCMKLIAPEIVFEGGVKLLEKLKNL